ncbi:hypothetical protein CDD80_5556 [Ophiocordyceps camponoti-rufipedis]|uniref:Thioesterase domain-containing protein n=1 Tax=Ophiocordyceps camponoti-rufipedis TaxID=2004952 RepID=A0A2C5YNF4_9HYPO|nr:hypothetical protein CDD80_5556 [Ophiocordyceps camponoti-rufipedis]
MVSKALTPTQFTKAVMRSFMAESGLERRLFPGNQFKVLSATAGRVDFELDILSSHTNRLKSLHGGTIASIVDLGGSLAIASMGRFYTGVSTDISGSPALPVSDLASALLTQGSRLPVTYIAPGGEAGDVLKGTAICDKMGGKLAYTRVTLVNQKGQLAAHGSHTKYAFAHSDSWTRLATLTTSRYVANKNVETPYVPPEEFSDVEEMDKVD